MQKKDGEQWPYIPMPKGRGFTAHFGKKSLPRCRGSDVFCLEGSAAVSYVLFSLAVRVIKIRQGCPHLFRWWEELPVLLFL